MIPPAAPAADPRLASRTEVLLERSLEDNYRRTSRVLATLMLAQWAFAVLVAALLSPVTWAGKTQSVSVHVPTAVLLGGLLTSLPVFLAWRWPAATLTRHLIAVAQMLWSALLIHLLGGRIETHFHVFGSLAFLAFYKDWRVLVPATVVVAGDHLLRGVFWPESVYGVMNPQWWRFLEHAGWVVFEDTILVLGCLRGVQELRALAQKQVETELLSESEREKSSALEAALAELERSHKAVLRAEKLAAVGQLAASVGHELRNPLGAVRNAVAYVSRRVLDPNASPGSLARDPRIPQFFGVMEQELEECSRIISGLLDFARERPPERRPCPLHQLANAAIELVPARANVRISNQVPDQLPIPQLDKDQFRQILVNLVQNASEAIPAEASGEVAVHGAATPDGGWRLQVKDNGAGMPPDVQENIFQPLFTTKTRGTGLGLAIVAGLVRSHRGAIQVESQPGVGTTFTITLPPLALTQAA